MTRADLIGELAKVSNLTRKESEAIVHIVFDPHHGGPGQRREGRTPGLRKLQDSPPERPQGVEPAHGQAS